MNKQDWLDYFEAINGRSPEESEIQAALAASEFQDAVAEPIPSVSEEPIAQPEPAPVVQTYQEPQTQGPVYPNQPQFQGQPAQAAYQGQANQQSYQGQAGNQQGFAVNHYTNENGQQIYNAQVAVPPQVSGFASQYWSWLVSAWKAPTSVVPTHKHNGWVSLGILVFLSATSIFSLGTDLEVFFKALLGFAFINFSYILAGFAVRRLIYKDATFTLANALEYYGRLFSPNILILGLASLFNILEVYEVRGLLIVISYCLYIAACSFTLYFDKDNSPLDRFYKYILASILFAVIVFFAFWIGIRISGNIFMSSLSGGLF